MKKTVSIVAAMAISVVILIALALYAAKAGSVNLTIGQILKGLFVSYDPEVAIAYDLRFPRILIAIMGGAALSVSGVMLQAVMKNPLTDPGIIGISAAASLTASLVAFFVPSLYFSIPGLAILGGLVAYLLIYTLAWEGGTDPVRLILVGVALNMTFIGIGEVLKGATGGNLTKVQSIIEGNVAQKTWADVRMMAIYAVVGLGFALLSMRTCNLLTLEDKTARALGVNVNRDRFIVALIAIVLASAATAIVGVIGFIGLIVPHIGRLIVGSDHRVLIPYSAILGSLLFLLSDTCGRLIAYPYEIPAAVLMTTLGGPFFIILLRMGGRRYGH